jgi:23S rRNA (cytosine1962-C5)-methyltransferase
MTDPSGNPEWEGYELLATGYGQRLERWCGRVILRPETAAHWPWHHPESLPAWESRYTGNRATGGTWEWRHPLPDPCIVRYKSLSLLVKPTNSKHLGLFPEQSANWEWITGLISASKDASTAGNTPPKVLNLFGYTGIASVVAAQARAFVTHVDASKQSLDWAHENDARRLRGH